GRMLGPLSNVMEGIARFHDDSPQLHATWIRNDNLHKNKYVAPVLLSVSQSGSTSEKTINVDFVADILTVHPQLNINLIIRTLEDQIVLCSSPRDDTRSRLALKVGRQQFTCKIPAALFNNIVYRFEIVALLHNIEFLWALGTGPQVELSI